VVQALSPDTSQKAFTDPIGARCMTGCGEYLDVTRCCNTSETGPKLALMITDEIVRRVSIGSCLPQLLRSPSVGRRARHPDIDHFPRFQFDDEERKERTEKEISDLQEITSLDFSGMMAQERRPVLPLWTRRTHSSHVLLDRSFAHANTQLEQLAPDALSSPEPIVACHLLD
jgi:hypothetical protein